MTNYIIDYMNNKDKIELAVECGLILTGFKDGVPEYLGDNRAWDYFNNGGVY